MTSYLARSHALALATAVALALALATPRAGADTPATPAASTATAATPARDRLAGAYTYVGGDKEVAAKDAAIARAADALFFAIRGLARSKLREVTTVRTSVRVAFGDGKITVTSSTQPPVVTADSGAQESYRWADGTPARAAQRVLGDGTLEQTFTADGGTRSVVYALSSDGRTLTVTHTIASPQLPRPVVYALTYRRDP